METENLLIRRFLNTDFDAFAALIRDKMSSPDCVFDHPFPTDDQGLRGILSYFAGTDEFYAVLKKPEAALIGFVALNREEESDVRNLGYYIHTAHREKGYGREAAERMIRFAGEELGVRRLISGTAEENVPSVRLLQRLGFTLRERTLGENPFSTDAAGKPMMLMGCSFERMI